MPKHVITETPHLTVVLQDYPTDTVFVTFNETGFVASGTKFWGDGFFERLEIAAVGVVSKAPHGYPLEDMRVAVEAINRITAGRRVVTFGCAQGAYGALKFSRALNAFASIACSPRYSIDPAHHGGPIGSQELCPKNYVFVDPLVTVETDHATRIAALADRASGQVELVPVFFADHRTIQLVSEGRIGTAMIRAFLAPKEPPERRLLRSLIRNARLASKTYHEHKIMHLLQRCQRGHAFLSRSLTSVPQSLVPILRVCLAFVSKPRTEAESSLADLKDADFAALPFGFLWQFFQRHEFAAAELRLAAALPVIAPRDPGVRLHGVTSLLKRGDKKQAAVELEEIVRLPGFAAHLQQVLDLARQLKAPRIMQELLDSPATRARFDDRQRQDIQLELAEMHAAMHDDHGLVRNIAALAKRATADQALRGRLVDLASQLDDHDAALRFAEGTFGLTGEPLQLFKLQLIDHLTGKSRIKARMRLEKIEPTLGRSAALWHRYAQCLFNNGDKFESLRAQKTAVRLAPSASREEWRVRLAELHIWEHQRLRGLLQFYRLSRNARRNVPVLVRGREAAHHLGLKRVELRFAKLIMRNQPGDPEPMVQVCSLYCALGEFRPAARLAVRVVTGVRSGREPSEASWLILIQVLQAVQRRDLAKAMLDEGLQRFPGNAELHRIRDADQVLHRFLRKDGIPSRSADAI